MGAWIALVADQVLRSTLVLLHIIPVNGRTSKFKTNAMGGTMFKINAQTRLVLGALLQQ